MAEVVEGMDDFLKSLDNLPLHIQEKLAANAIRASLRPTHERLVASLPRRTGKLKKEGTRLAVDRSDPTNPLGQIGFTSKGHYGRYQHGQPKRSQRDQFRAIINAWESNRDKMIDILGRRLGRGIAREFKRLNKRAS